MVHLNVNYSLLQLADGLSSHEGGSLQVKMPFFYPNIGNLTCNIHWPYNIVFDDDNENQEVKLRCFHVLTTRQVDESESV